MLLAGGMADCSDGDAAGVSAGIAFARFAAFGGAGRHGGVLGGGGGFHWAYPDGLCAGRRGRRNHRGSYGALAFGFGADAAAA